MHHDKITNSVGNRATRCISAYSVNGATLLGQKAKDLLGKLRIGCSEVQEGIDVGSLLLNQCRGRREADVEREAKRTTDSRNAADDIGAIDRAAAPSVGGGMSSFSKNCDGAKIIGGDGHCFVQEAMEVLNANSLAIALSSNMNGDVKDSADFFEETFENRKADIQEDILNE